MRAKLVVLAAVTMAAVVVGLYTSQPRAAEKKDKDPMLVHHVYFTLKERTAEAKKKLVDSCNKYLTKHEGEVFYSVGTLAEDLKSAVNDRDFDVCLTIVFENKAAHDKYQPHKRHQDFIKENKASFDKVRVFDAYATK